jgi:hypothetical protein
MRCAVRRRVITSIAKGGKASPSFDSEGLETLNLLGERGQPSLVARTSTQAETSQVELVPLSVDPKLPSPRSWALRP